VSGEEMERKESGWGVAGAMGGGEGGDGCGDGGEMIKMVVGSDDEGCSCLHLRGGPVLCGVDGDGWINLHLPAFCGLSGRLNLFINRSLLSIPTIINALDEHF
jgi:hypothetical protein